MKKVAKRSAVERGQSNTARDKRSARRAADGEAKDADDIALALRVDRRLMAERTAKAAIGEQGELKPRAAKKAATKR